MAAADISFRGSNCRRQQNGKKAVEAKIATWKLWENPRGPKWGSGFHWTLEAFSTVLSAFQKQTKVVEETTYTTYVYIYTIDIYHTHTHIYIYIYLDFQYMDVLGLEPCAWVCSPLRLLPGMWPVLHTVDTEAAGHNWKTLGVWRVGQRKNVSQKLTLPIPAGA